MALYSYDEFDPLKSIKDPLSLGEGEREEDESPFGRELSSTTEKKPASSKAAEAWRAVSEVDGSRPVRQKPGFWRTLAGLGAGFGAGYVNAGGRTRPIDAAGITRSIMSGDYDQQVQDWESRRADAITNAEAASKAEQAEQDYLDAPTDRYYKQTQADYMRSTMNQRGQEPQDEVVRTIEKVDGNTGKYVAVKYWKSGKTTTEPLEITEPVEAKPAKEVKYSRDITSPDGTVTTLNVYSDGSTEEIPASAKAAPPNQARRIELTPGEMATDLRARTENALEIESRKNTRLRDAVSTWQESLKNQMTGATRQPGPEDLERLRQLKQQVQNQYEGELRAAGFQGVQHFEYPPEAGAMPQPQSSAAPLGKTPEQEAQEYLNRIR